MSFTRNGIWGAVAVGLLFSPVALWAELDKDDVEKKEAKEIRPGGDFEPVGGDSEDYQRRLIEEGEKNLEEINKLLDQIQKGMAGRKTGTGVQGKQQEVVERLEKLIVNLGKCSSSCSSSAGQASEKKSPSEQKQGKQKAENEDQQASGKEQKKMQAQQQKPEGKKSEKEENKGKVANNRTEDAPPPDAKAGSLKNRFLQARRWGVLPSKIADSMLSSVGKEAPHEYREIISRYYKRMTEMYKGGAGK